MAMSLVNLFPQAPRGGGPPQAGELAKNRGKSPRLTTSTV